ncbi:YhjD/YihY/BrkB family envelope integrity protein [Nocardioides marinquilinus]|uniref:YhjD/YihY/BrkB family envelope integrity protein n=1 Tax=Nocardioides marinquilinus TaxID=1210400 RepID=A0ABP9PEE5_9ACTN
MSTLATLAGHTRLVVGGVRRDLAGAPLPSAAAGLTYFGGIAVVPWALLVMWSSSVVHGDEAAERRWASLAVLVPPDMGGRRPYGALVDAGTHLSLLGALVLLLPASFYGEGLRRACLALRPRDDAPPDTWTGWRGRLLSLPSLAVLVVAGLVALPVLEAARGLAPDGGGGGVGDWLLRVVVGFTVTWLGLALPLAWALRAVAPGRTSWTAALLGGLAIGSFLAGFLQGFLLFLAIPIDVGLPFAGLTVVGAVVAVGLWLFVLHTVVLLGWLLVAEADDPDARATRRRALAGDAA